jgi:uncharacterized protein YpmS
MEHIISWLIQNKAWEWIFSGLGVVILVALVSIIMKLVKSREQTHLDRSTEDTLNVFSEVSTGSSRTNNSNSLIVNVGSPFVLSPEDKKNSC